jgi:hypothetical protein
MALVDRGGHDAELVIRPYLEPAERLLWSGHPRRGLLFRTADIGMVPFSLLWGGFAIFWTYSALREGAPWPFVLPAAASVLIGLNFIAGRFLVEAKQRERTLYGVTSERVIIVSGLWTRQVKSLGRASPYGWWFPGTAWPGMPSPPPCFERIPGAKQVYDLIRQAQRSS